MEKRAFDATSSGEPCQTKRLCLDPDNRVWDGSESNHVRRSCLTVEDVLRVLREEAERIISPLAESIQREMLVKRKKSRFLSIIFLPLDCEAEEIKIFVKNISTIGMVEYLVYYTCTTFHIYTQHFDIRYHFICEQVKEEDMKVSHVKTGHLVFAKLLKIDVNSREKTGHLVFAKLLKIDVNSRAKTGYLVFVKPLEIDVFQELTRLLRMIDGKGWCIWRHCCVWDALKNLAERVHSTEDAVRRTEDAVKSLMEAVELANIHSPHVARAIAISAAKSGLRLQFQTKLSLPLYTGKKLEGEGGAYIYVALINSNTGDIVKSGPEASIMLDVVVLDGDFNEKDEENWAPGEFENSVVRQREGKPPLLKGDLLVTLKEGLGVLGDLMFTDNSSWTRSKSFRIGLKVAAGYQGNARIREGKTDAFAVKEQRGEGYKKHYPPASDDEVWRLDNIAKNGPPHKRLNEAKIFKVEEFLRQLFVDSENLRNLLGTTEKKWEALKDHANTCVPNGKLYVYYHGNESRQGVIFNNLGRINGLIVHGVCYAADGLSTLQKGNADRLVKKACEDWNDVREFDPEATSSSMSEKISCSFLPGVLGGQQCCHIVHDNAPSKLASQVGFRVPPESSAFTGEGNISITAAELPIQSSSLNPPNATWSQTNESLNQMVSSAAVDTGNEIDFERLWGHSPYGY